MNIDFEDNKSSQDVELVNLEVNSGKPQLEQNFGIGSLFALSFGLTASWLGVSSTFATGISSGGPMLIVYGLIIGFVFNLFVALTLGE